MPETDLLDEILKTIDEFDMAPTAFGKLAANDPSLLNRMKKRRTLGRKLMGARLERRVRKALLEVQAKQIH